MGGLLHEFSESCSPHEALIKTKQNGRLFCIDFAHSAAFTKPVFAQSEMGGFLRYIGVFALPSRKPYET